MRFCVVALLVFGLAVLPSISSSGEKKTDKDVKKEASIWMKSKNKLSQEILMGLTEGDFDKIKKNARALDVVNFLEVLFRAKSDEYREQTSQFSAANKQLIRQAEAKNIYGAALAYSQLTLSCVQCHVVVRKANK